MIGKGALIAGPAGVGLFLVMFIGWFGESGWSSVGWFGASVIAAAALTAVALALVVYTRASVSLPVALSTLTAALGAIALVVIAYRAIDPPADGERELGLYLGLVAAAALALGGWIGMQEDRPPA